MACLETISVNVCWCSFCNSQSCEKRVGDNFHSFLSCSGFLVKYWSSLVVLGPGGFVSILNVECVGFRTDDVLLFVLFCVACPWAILKCFWGFQVARKGYVTILDFLDPKR